MAEAPCGERLGWSELAKRAWRCGIYTNSEYIFDLERARVGAPGVVPFGITMVAPVIMKFGTDEQKAEFPAQDTKLRHLVLPGILRARIRI